MLRVEGDGQRNLDVLASTEVVQKILANDGSFVCEDIVYTHFSPDHTQAAGKPRRPPKSRG